jgi:hypothetical protein
MIGGNGKELACWGSLDIYSTLHCNKQRCVDLIRMHCSNVGYNFDDFDQIKTQRIVPW